MKKTLAILLAAVLMFSALPVGFSAMAEATGEITQIDNCDSYYHGWSGATLDIQEYREGSGSIRITDSKINLTSPDYNISCEEGIKTKKFIEFWLFVSDVSDLDSFVKATISQTNGTSSVWNFSNQLVQDGWNKISLSLSVASNLLTTLNTFSISLSSISGDDLTVRLDDICFSYTKKVENTAVLDKVIEQAKTFDTSGLSDHVIAKVNNYIAYAEQGVKTQRDVELIAKTLTDIMDKTETLRATGIFTDTITTHGRTYYKDNALYFNYSATGFSVRFYGTELKATMKASEPNAILNIYVDQDINQVTFNSDTSNDQQAREQYNQDCPHIRLTTEENEYTVVSGLTEGVHTVTLLKRGEVTYTGNAILLGLNAGNGNLLAPPQKSTRTIEFIGDSNTTGYGNMALGTGGYSAETQDGTITYATYAANELGAEYSIVARSGICVTPAADPYCSEGYMTDTYLYTDYWNNGTNELYDFASNPSDVVVIHLGDNDHDGRAGNLTPDQFVESMKNFIRQVRVVNPDSKIVLAFSVCGYLDWRPLMQRAVNEINAEGDTEVYNYAFATYNNAAPAGHASMSAHKGAGHELAEYIRTLTDWKGQTKEIYSNPTIQNGTINISESYAETEKTVTFTVVPDKGCILKEGSVSVVSKDENIAFTENNGVYSFTMPTDSVMINAEFLFPGDINLDGEINTADALLALQAAVGKVHFDEKQQSIADVNQDGSVSTGDALLILQMAVGKISEFETIN